MARSPLLLLAVLAVPLALWVQTPGNLGKIKGVLKPGLSLLPFWLGDGSALTDKHVDLLNGPSFGADGCEVKFEGLADACEDGEMHYPSHTAFWACSTIQSRETFWPPQRLWNRTAPREQDYVVKYDVKTGELTRLKTPGYDGDVVTHGFGLYVPSPESDHIFIHLINHKTHPQSCVTVFRHQLGTDTMEHVLDNCDPLIVSPNDVAPTGETSFYMANAHFSNSHGRGGFQQFLVNVEDELGKWKLTNVIYCPGGTQPCRKVAGGHVGANGVLLVPDKQNGGQLLMVDDWPGAYLAVYKVNSDHSLTKLEEIPLGSPIDNLSYDPVADAFLAATFPSIKGFLHHYLHPWTNKFAPISVTRIKRLPDENGKTKHEAKIVMYTDKLTGSISTVLSDSDYDVTVIGGIKNRGLTICPRAMAKDEGGIPA